MYNKKEKIDFKTNIDYASDNDSEDHLPIIQSEMET